MATFSFHAFHAAARQAYERSECALCYSRTRGCWCTIKRRFVDTSDLTICYSVKYLKFVISSRLNYRYFNFLCLSIWWVMVPPIIFFQNSTFSIMPHLSRKRGIALMAIAGGRGAPYQRKIGHFVLVYIIWHVMALVYYAYNIFYNMYYITRSSFIRSCTSFLRSK